MYNSTENNKADIEEKIKLGWKDILAITIAQFSILVPIVLGGILVMFIILLFFTKVWMNT